MLKFELSLGTLNEYTVGERLESSVSKLQEGYTVYCSNECISSIFVCFNYGYRGFSSFLGKVIVDGQIYEFAKNTTSDQVRKLLGEPHKEWTDEIEQCYHYYYEGFRVEISWDIEEGSILNYISAVSIRQIRNGQND